MKAVGSTIRIIILLIVAVISLLILVIFQPEVHYDKYAEQKVENGLLTDDRVFEEHDHPDNWTKKTRGHRIALAISHALAPRGSTEKIPKTIVDKGDDRPATFFQDEVDRDARYSD